MEGASHLCEYVDSFESWRSVGGEVPDQKLCVLVFGGGRHLFIINAQYNYLAIRARSENFKRKKACTIRLELRTVAYPVHFHRYPSAGLVVLRGFGRLL